MMKKIKFSLKRPVYSEILIYDQVGSEFIIEALGGTFSWQVLRTRGRRINLHPTVLLRLWSAFIRSYRVEKSLTTVRRSRLVAELAEISAISPRAVLTFVDNSARFNVLSRLYPEAAFLAVQNGFRGIEVGGMAHYLSATNFFCFGEDTKNRYQRFGCNIDNYIIGGSLKDGLYRGRHYEPPDHVFDYCWISQFRPVRFSRTLPGLAQSSILLLKFLSEFCEENSKSLVIAGSCKPDLVEQEVQFLSSFVDVERISFVPNDPSTFSSYQIIDQSEVSVTVNSTLGFEALSRGKKVIFCNFTDDEYYDVPSMDEDAPWIIKGSATTYALFAKKLENAYQMSRREWRKVTDRDAQNFVNTSVSTLPQEVLRREVTRLVSGHDTVQCRDNVV